MTIDRVLEIFPGARVWRLQSGRLVSDTPIDIFSNKTGAAPAVELVEPELLRTARMARRRPRRESWFAKNFSLSALGE